MLTNNTFIQAAILINIYALRDVNSIILQNSNVTQLICANIMTTIIIESTF